MFSRCPKEGFQGKFKPSLEASTIGPGCWEVKAQDRTGVRGESQSTRAPRHVKPAGHNMQRSSAGRSEKTASSLL